MTDPNFWPDIFKASTMLFFILDPFGNIPLFNSILKPFSEAEKRKIICRENVFALIVLLAFLFIGPTMMNFLGLEKPALSFAGGIVLFIIAIKMLYPGKSDGEEVVDDPFIVPLAIPLVAGPTTIATLLLASSNEPEKTLSWVIALVIAWSASTLLLISSPYLIKFLGERGLKAMERLMGLLLVIMAIQFILNGFTQYIALHFPK